MKTTSKIEQGIGEPVQSWTVTLEQDPESGDLIMPLPSELLSQMGWDFGDTLIWDVDEITGTASLSKSNTE